MTERRCPESEDPEILSRPREALVICLVKQCVSVIIVINNHVDNSFHVCGFGLNSHRQGLTFLTFIQTLLAFATVHNSEEVNVMALRSLVAANCLEK